MLLILLMSIYLMIDYSRVNAALLNVFPRPWQPRVMEFSDLVGTAVGGYVRGQLLIASFIGVFVWLGLTIVGIPSAAAIGFLAGRSISCRTWGRSSARPRRSCWR